MGWDGVVVRAGVDFWFWGLGEVRNGVRSGDRLCPGLGLVRGLGRKSGSKVRIGRWGRMLGSEVAVGDWEFDRKLGSDVRG